MADEPEHNGQGRGSTARRIVLGAQLRRLRESQDITRADAGWSIRSSESKISRMELGRVGFKERDVADLLTMYGVHDDAERGPLLELVRDSNKPDWWRRYSDAMPAWFNDFVGLEEAAARIQTFEMQFIPGLLQTEDYTRAIVDHGRPQDTREERERRVALRMKRQRALNGPTAPRLWAVLDESVLHRPIGGRRVHRAQLEYLLEATRMPNITVQVLPYHLSGYAAEHSFTFLRFQEAELPDLVYVELLTSGQYIEQAKDIETYSRALDRLAVDAETPEQSRQTLHKFLNEV